MGRAVSLLKIKVRCGVRLGGDEWPVGGGVDRKLERIFQRRIGGSRLRCRTVSTRFLHESF